MPKIPFDGYEFDSRHETICAALFNKYGWEWEQPPSLPGWRPDFLLKGETSVYVECKGQLKWDDFKGFSELPRYEDAVARRTAEVLLIPEAPRRAENKNGFMTSVLGFLYDGEKWSYAELGRWSGTVGFCHSANSWKDRMSGEDVGNSSGDGRAPDVDLDWRSAEQIINNKRAVFFQAFNNSETEEWEIPS